MLRLRPFTSEGRAQGGGHKTEKKENEKKETENEKKETENEKKVTENEKKETKNEKKRGKRRKLIFVFKNMCKGLFFLQI